MSGPCPEGHGQTAKYHAGVPLYEFECEGCGARFSELVAAGAVAPCPECANPAPRRLWSAPGLVKRLQVTGLAAQRSEASRREREERHRERREATDG